MTARNWHKKSKAGCVTCKQRRIKCDENRPICLRCKRGGRECLGYQVDANQPSHSPPAKRLKFVQSKYESLVLARSPSPNAQDESELLSFFLNVTVPSVTSYLPCKVWQQANIKHQLSNTAFKDIAMAIATHHQSIERSTASGKSTPDGIRGLKSYSKALMATQHLIAGNNANLKSAIFGNIFLIILECMRGSAEALKIHLLSGLRVLRVYGHQLDAYTRSEFHQIYTTVGLSCIVQYLDLEIFAELEKLPRVELPNFSPLADFERLRAATGHVIVQTYCAVSKVALNFFKDEEEIKSTFDACYRELDRMDEELQSCSLIDRHTSLALRDLVEAKLALCRIFLDSCLSRMQSSYDQHYDSFQRIVNLMSRVLKQRTEEDPTANERPWSFSFGSGLMAILTFVFTTCRHPQIRREALNLLDICPRKEGLRSVNDSRKIGQALIKYEEAGVCDTEQDYTIPEHNRVHFPRYEPSSEANPNSILYALHRSNVMENFKLAVIPLDHATI